jgi:uncharacterized protein YhbP (UPF0306 family)
MADKPNKRAKEIIEEILYITIATASKDGKPWNSPVYSAYDKNYNFFWASAIDAKHSQNIHENSQVALVIYNSKAPAGTGEGVYIQAKAYQLTNEKEIDHALKHLEERINHNPPPPSNFLGKMPRRVYKAVLEKAWMNTDATVNGQFVDKRIEIDLLKK